MCNYDDFGLKCDACCVSSTESVAFCTGSNLAFSSNTVSRWVSASVAPYSSNSTTFEQGRLYIIMILGVIAMLGMLL